MKKIKKKILVTCALPYSNGSIHLGHLLEHIQADIWVRYQKNIGNEVYFICADDAHGTAIMLKADQLGVSPEKMIEKINLEHQNSFSKFNINYDNYYTTHSKENYFLSVFIYNKLKLCGYIKFKQIVQFFDQKKNIFLSDRFVKGSCPKCYSDNQFGDNCENCGYIYDAINLINPISVLSGIKPILKKTEHIFFDLPLFLDKLYIWINSGSLQKQVLNKILEWFILGLKQWDISRDYPYFGFLVPDMSDKYFYVWLDAPIGYMSSFKNFCNSNLDINFDEFWNANSETELYHFIGKDIIYFHSLFWPAILDGSGFRKPTGLFVHGHLTINGVKMSKSKSNYITADSYLKYLDPDCLRYYYANKLSSSINDVDLNFNDFVKRFNGDIINKVINLASRNANFINNFFCGKLSSEFLFNSLYYNFINSTEFIGNFYHNRDTNKAIHNIMLLADLANKYITLNAPWLALKENRYKDVHNICSMGIEFFRILMIFLSPVIPSLSKKVEYFLKTKLSWKLINKPLISHQIRPLKILFNRINISDIEKFNKI